MIVWEQNRTISKIACAITGSTNYELQLGAGTNDLDLRSMPKDRPLHLDLVNAHGTPAENASILQDALRKADYQWFPDAHEPTVPLAELKRAIWYFAFHRDVFWHDEHGIYLVTAAFLERCGRNSGKIVLVLAQKDNPHSYGTVTIHSKALSHLSDPSGKSLAPALKLRISLHRSSISHMLHAPRWYDFRLAQDLDGAAQMRVYEFRGIRRIGVRQQVGRRIEYRLSDARPLHAPGLYEIEVREISGETVFESIDCD